MMTGRLRSTRQALGRLRRLWANRDWLDPLLVDGNSASLRFAPPGHFYSPLPNLSEVAAQADAIYQECPCTDLPGIDLRAATQLELAVRFASFYPELPFGEQESSGQRYHLDNAYFSYGDAVILFGMLRHYRPRRVIEVGSGYSSAAMLDINNRFFDDAIEFTFIEPYPTRLHALLTDDDRRSHVIIEQPVETLPLETFALLGEKDVLFIDSSHVVKIGSDVQHLLFRVLPSLANGTLIHIHDITWPFEYPQHWIRGGRAWNEAYVLRAFLQYNEAFEVVYFNSYMAHHQRRFLETHMPLAIKQPSRASTIGNSSLWLRKVR